MTIEICKLHEVMEKMDKNVLSSFLSEFRCSRSRDSEHFLRKTALKHEARDISRTYLAIDLEKNIISGYFTLAFKCLNVKDIGMDAHLTEMMNVRDDVAQSYLIGQLARSDDAERGSGRIMLDEALRMFFKGKGMFGCRTVRLDCRDELVDYYISRGFQPIGKNADLDLNQMAKFI